jgi:3'-phosphoadenosine 5'-phosphosulfate sulfotransferase (PAPS reductase)/FAD synthetase
MNPYKFNEPVHIAFSGGRSSGFMLKQIIDAGLPEGSQVVFCNTGKEMEETLEFVRDCSINWNVPIVWCEYVPYDSEKPDDLQFKIVNFDTASRNGEPFMEMIRKVNYLPNPVTRKCSYMLKIRTAAKYCKSVGLDVGENDSIVGFRYDEMRRVNKLACKSNAPMAMAKHTKADVTAFWATQGFDLKLPNFNGITKHGNCDLCFLKGAHQVYSLIFEKPERAIWWAEAEAEALASKPTGARFHKDRPSYQEMLDNVRNQGDWIGNADDESISCFCGD